MLLGASRPSAILSRTAGCAGRGVVDIVERNPENSLVWVSLNVKRIPVKLRERSNDEAFL